MTEIPVSNRTDRFEYEVWEKAFLRYLHHWTWIHLELSPKNITQHVSDAKKMAKWHNYLVRIIEEVTKIDDNQFNDVEEILKLIEELTDRLKSGAEERIDCANRADRCESKQGRRVWPKLLSLMVIQCILLANDADSKKLKKLLSDEGAARKRLNQNGDFNKYLYTMDSVNKNDPKWKSKLLLQMKKNYFAKVSGKYPKRICTSQELC